ncbi:MAG TPA: hypothetical protein VL993_03095 [Stellaceae bacterium]|nr:hypothetical protein [Stellaceae bacterium]
MMLVVFIGFSRTYYLKAYFDSPPLTPLRIVHGAVFTTWMVLFIVQTGLVAANRRDIHRRLGLVGAGIAALMVGLGVALAVSALRDGHAPSGGPSPAALFALPIFIIFVFLILFVLGIVYRARPQFHKRFMTLATAAILAAAVARFPLSFIKNPFVFFGLTDIFIVACGTYDLFARGRVHPATVWGGVAIIASQVLSLLVGRTAFWVGFSAWLAS